MDGIITSNGSTIWPYLGSISDPDVLRVCKCVKAHKAFFILSPTRNLIAFIIFREKKLPNTLLRIIAQSHLIGAMLKYKEIAKTLTYLEHRNISICSFIKFNEILRVEESYLLKRPYEFTIWNWSIWLCHFLTTGQTLRCVS